MKWNKNKILSIIFRYFDNFINPLKYHTCIYVTVHVSFFLVSFKLIHFSYFSAEERSPQASSLFLTGDMSTPASSSGVSFFAWQRRARNKWLVMNRKGPWEGYRWQAKRLPDLVSFSWHGPIFGLFKSWKRSLNMCAVFFIIVNISLGIY